MLKLLAQTAGPRVIVEKQETYQKPRYASRLVGRTGDLGTEDIHDRTHGQVVITKTLKMETFTTVRLDKRVIKIVKLGK